jgi:hypothetical protein
VLNIARRVAKVYLFHIFKKSLIYSNSWDYIFLWQVKPSKVFIYTTVQKNYLPSKASHANCYPSQPSLMRGRNVNYFE